MIVCIPKVLAPDQLSHLRAAIEIAPFVDGRATAAEPAKLVKKNLQVDKNLPAMQCFPKRSVMLCSQTNSSTCRVAPDAFALPVQSLRP